MGHQGECVQNEAATPSSCLFLIRPEGTAANFEVRLWIIAHKEAAVHVQRSHAAHWLTFSRLFSSLDVLDDARLGLVDACIARGEAVQFWFEKGISVFKEIAFEEVFAAPRTKKIVVLAQVHA